MEITNYRDIAALENNWWYRARGELIGAILEHIRPRYARVLDCGCGVGTNYEILRPLADEVIGLDSSPEALSFAAKKGYQTLLSSVAEKINLPDASVDVVLAADVLEHIDNDAVAVREIVRVLRPGGVFLAAVPALPTLWNKNDEYSHHQRRYTKRMLSRLLFEEGLMIECIRYWNFFSLAPVWAVSRWEKIFGGTEANNLSLVPHWVNGVLLIILRFENFLFFRLPLPLGVSLVAVARKI